MAADITLCGITAWYYVGMGSTQTTRQKIAAGQSVKFAAAHRMLKALTDAVDIAGSHHHYFIGEHRLTVSKHKSGELLPYQRKQIDHYLNQHGK